MPLADATIAERLAGWLPTARWFADKAARITGVDVVAAISLDGDETGQGTAALVVADVRFPGGRPAARYVFALGDDARDVASTPEVVGRLLRMILSGGSCSGRGGRFVGRRLPAALSEDAFDATSTSGPLTVDAIGGDASNSSFIVRGGTAGWVVKLVRRCRPGIQPAVELGRFFAEASPWAETPRLCGWLEFEASPGDDSAAIATVHEFAPGRTTGWDHMVSLLAAGGGAAGGIESILPIVTALGASTARMHRALAARADLADFAPAPPTVAGRRAAAARMAEHAARVATLIDSRLDGLSPAIASRLGRVLSMWPDLVGLFDSYATVAPATPDIRVHGDYHLGQVLVAEHDGQSPAAVPTGPPLARVDPQVLVIDFEGEPGRSLEERRMKTSAAKDVAGMCRSFDYLLRHVARSTGRPSDTADLARLEDRYLDAYRGEASGQPWWPDDRNSAAALLAIFKLDKAIYELAYELGNRPDWIEVPLAAVEAATRAPPPG